MLSDKNSSNQERLVLIDALRGIAALGVLLHHLYNNTEMHKALKLVLPSLPFNLGALGVEVFFVISGFVIALSVSNTVQQSSDVFKFMLRRQLRLDIPYWSTIALTLGLVVVDLILFSGIEGGFYSPEEILINAAYLQRILSTREIINVAWTLCIEMQFYLIFLFIWTTGLYLRQKLRIKQKDSLNHAQNITWIIYLVFFTGLISIVTRNYHIHDSPWFFHYWFYFASGSLCFWSYRSSNKTPSYLLFVLMGTLLAASIYFKALDLFTGFLTVLFIHIAGRFNKLHVWMNWRVLQFSGKISYSLYLTHIAVGCTFLSIAYKITGLNPLAAILWLLLSVIISIGFAWFFYILIERPSMNLAKRVKYNTLSSSHIPAPSSTSLTSEG